MSRILITSGPTRQPLDPVRFLTNGSSGRMGGALADAVLKRGATPVIVTGPVTIDYPRGCEVHRVTTTDEMREAAVKLFGNCVGAIGAAAPCDFMPQQVSTQKIKRDDQQTEGTFTLVLVATPDILKSLGEIKRHDQWLVAFALETENGRENALAKLRRKNADFVVLNTPAAIDADECRVEVYDATARCIVALTGTKQTVADKILDAVWA
ncbi:MAG: phosphopantothenoylcysteine decarboxylase [Thermoguttaceae bacterium]